MVTPGSQKPRATTWLCLAAAVLIAVLPAGGVMMCLGHDGHVGLGYVELGYGGLGVASTESECPCQHERETATALVAWTSLELDDDGHPPCDDLSLEAPDVFKDADASSRLTEALADQNWNDTTPLIPTGWSPNAGWPDTSRDREAYSTSVAGLVPRQQLEHKRVVVLLI